MGIGRAIGGLAVAFMVVASLANGAAAIEQVRQGEARNAALYSAGAVTFGAAAGIQIALLRRRRSP